MKRQRTFYLGQQDKTADPRNSEAGEVYTYEVNGKLYAIAFTGKQSKPALHYRFLTLQSRTDEIDAFFKGLDQKAALKAERRAARKAPLLLEIGDILYASWGYDQTNIDFYQVTATTKKTVTFRKIGQEIIENSHGFMCEDVIAKKDCFLDDKEYTRKAAGERLTFAESEGGYRFHLSKWNGRPLYQSHYA